MNQASGKSCETSGILPPMRIMSFNPLKPNDVCQDNQVPAKVHVTVSGKSFKLAGFPDYPEVYLAFYEGAAPDPMPLTPTISAGTIGFATKIKDAGGGTADWLEQTEDRFAAPTTTLHVEVVVWHRYHNTFTNDTYILIEKLDIIMPAGDIPGCPE